MNPTNPWKDEHRGIVNGIADERHVYCTATCLVRSSRLKRLPRDYPFIRDAERKRAQARSRKNQDEKFVVQTMSIGMLGFHCGPHIHIIDLYGLTDPLLARLPILEDPNWRIGHFIRKVPVGYRESIATGTNRIQERDLAELHDVLTLINQGPLLSGERLLEIVKINMGLHSHLVDPDGDRFFDMPRVFYSQVVVPKEAGTPWYTEGNWFLPDEGIEIDLERTFHARGLEVSFDNNDDYQIFFYRGEVQVGSSKVERKKYKKGGLRTYKVDVPEEAAGEGYDLIVIEPLAGDGRYVMGHLRLVK
jgi:arabinofuranosyltransferase